MQMKRVCSDSLDFTQEGKEGKAAVTFLALTFERAFVVVGPGETMKNLRLSVSMVDGSLLPLDYENGRELIEGLFSDDWGAPPKHLRIEADTGDGQTVRIVIPYSDSAEATVRIEGTQQ
jgi:hypothetical protein